MNNIICRYLIVALLLNTGLVAAAGTAEPAQPPAAALKLHGLFGDNMVLQQGGPIPVWGTAPANAEVTVTLDVARQFAKADAQGRWRVRLPAAKAGGPYQLTVAAGGQTITLTNVIVGEVWLCSGQSNMEMALRDVENAPAEIATAGQPELRLFTVPHTISDKPLDDVHGAWVVCTPETVSSFSAVAYFFGRELQARLGVPVGLIAAPWGGTWAESWTTPATLNTDPVLAPILRRYQQDVAGFTNAWKKYEEDLAAWWQQHPEARASFQHDPGNQGVGWGWARPDFDDAAWTNMDLPRLWEGLITVNGSIWFRKKLELPAEWAGKDLDLSLGPIDDFDTTYFDGEPVGATGRDGDQVYMVPRRYRVPGNLVKAGTNVVAVRVFDHFGGGGFGGSRNMLTLGPAGSSNTLSLAGPWQYRIEQALDPAKLKPFPAGMPYPAFIPQNQLMPGGLFNGMIHPLLDFAFRGAAWYQGESNGDRGEQYRTLLPAMIGDWRRGAGREFPFLIVQLPIYGADWSEVREAEALTARRVPRVGLAVTLDLPDGDLHPRIKRPVGRRLALSALAVAYGQKVDPSGPEYRSMKVEGNALRLTFDAHGGLTAAGGTLTGFVIAGADQKFVPAQARIEGATIVVRSDQVPHPVAARYAWGGGGNGSLRNVAGLPCGSFRTDDWPVLTTGRR